MKIPHQILTQNRSYGGSYYNHTNISEKNLIILSIFHLHNQGFINDAKLKAHCKQYNNGTLFRNVNLYHSKINDTWYDDTNTFDIFMDVYFQKCVEGDLTMDKMLKYLNLLTNKNINYCIDHLFFEYAQPVIQKWSNGDDVIFKIISEFDFGLSYKSYDEMSDTGELTYGYCCSDCDGCLGEHKRNQYRNYVGSEISHEKHIKGYMNNLKNDSGKRNPRNRLTC
jgi:hypothetical protein